MGSVQPAVTRRSTSTTAGTYPSVDLNVAVADPSIETIRGKYTILEHLTEPHVHAFWANQSPNGRMQAFEYLQGPRLRSADDLWNLFASERFMFAVKLLPADAFTDGTANESKPELLNDEATIHGIVGYSPIHKEHRELEIGALFDSSMQRTRAATEAMYLLLKNVCDAPTSNPARPSPVYRRVVWKCDSLHAKSCSAALRLGFFKEGTFRKHMIVSYQGKESRSRDTDWFSLTDEDWNGGTRQALEEWLEEENFDAAGVQRRRLEDIRKAMQH